MNKQTLFAHTKLEEEVMKEVHMLLGFGIGLVTGVLLYKYSTGTKKTVDKAEKAVAKEVDMVAEKAKKATEKAQITVKKARNN